MEDNHFVILDKYPSNQLITRIQMTSNTIFPLTLNPSMKRKTTQVVYEVKDVHSETTFKAEREEVSVHYIKEEQCSACDFKKEEDSGTELQEAFQSQVKDDS
jgi:hypothetical protein